MATTNYVVDANVFINAYKWHYSFEFGTKFWDLLLKAGVSGRVVSIDRVRDELTGRGDELSNWVGNCKGTFVSTDRPDVLDYYKKLNAWAENQAQYTRSAKAIFADSRKADAWIVAYALAGGHVVVTHEVSAPQCKKSVKIPDACKAFGVTCIDPFTMLRELGWKFI